MDFTEIILKVCEEFQTEWAETVRTRLLYASDLPAADAVYHQLCSVNFRTGKQIPQLFRTKMPQSAHKYKRFSGRPKYLIRMESFLKVADYLEQNDATDNPARITLPLDNTV
jgi:hypothetical protein